MRLLPSEGPAQVGLMVIRIAAGEEAPETVRQGVPRRAASRPEEGRVLGAIGAVVRRLPAILLVAALPLLAAAAYLKLQPPRFTAMAGVFADPAAGRVGGATMAQADGYIPLATSRPVFDRAVEAGNLAGDPAIIVGPAPLVQRVRDLVDRLRGQPPEPSGRRTALIQHLNMYASARPSSEANVIDIAVSATDAASAARLANAVAEAFVEEASAALERRASAGAPRKIGRGDELRRRLREAEAALQRFRADAGLNAAADPATELQRLRTQVADAKARHERVQQALAPGGSPQALEDLLRSPAIDRLRADANEATSQEASMRSTLGPRHPSYLAAASNAAEQKKILAEALRLAATAVRADWQAAEAQVRAAESGTASPRIAAQPPVGSADAMRLAELEGAVRSARAALDAHLRSPEASSEGAVARIVRPAAVPQNPAAPSPGLIWSIAAVTALILLVGKILRILFAPGSIRRRARTSGPRADEQAPQVRAPRMAPATSHEQQDERHGMEREQRRSADPFIERRNPAGVQAAPGAAEIAGLVRQLSDRAWSVALQTTLVVGADGADVAATAMEIAIGAAAENLRVLLLDANERAPALSRVLSDVPLSAYVTIQDRKRAIGAFESRPGHPIWFAPAESLAYTRGKPQAPVILPSVAGHFDILLLTGPDIGMKAGEDMLAAASELVAVVTTGEERDTSAFAARLRIPASKLRVIPGAVPKVERRRGAHDDEPLHTTSLFRFQDD